jgi:hypothetical protein
MRRSTRLAMAAGFMALAVCAGTAAFAAVSGTPVASVNGNGGYDAATADPAGFTDVQSVVTGGQYGLTVDAGAHGVQLCSKTSSFGAQVGLLSDNLKTTYHVASGTGTIPGAGCPVGGVLPVPVDFPALTAVPYGHRVWLDASLIHKVKTFTVLICIIKDRQHDTLDPLAPDQAPPVGIDPKPGEYGGFRCFIKHIRIIKDVVVFMAQDLDAPTAVPVAGDLPGVQTRYVRVPHGTVFDNAGAGVNENLTKLVACAGNGFPKALAGPAAYVTAACQPISAFDHTTASVAAGPATGLSALATTEGVSPGTTTATPALIAPDNTLAVTPGSVPPGTAVNASTGGDSFTMFSGNAPTS